MLEKHEKSLLSNLNASAKNLLDIRMEEKELNDLWLNVLVEECLNFYEAGGMCNTSVPEDVCRIVSDIMGIEKIVFETFEFISPTHGCLAECLKKTHGHRVSSEIADQINFLLHYIRVVEDFIRRDSLFAKEEMHQMFEVLCKGAIPLDVLAVENKLRLGKILEQSAAPVDLPADKKPEVSDEILSAIRSEIEGLKFNVSHEYWVKGIILVCGHLRQMMMEPGIYGVEGTLNAYAYWILENFPLVGKVYTHEQLVKVLGKSEPYSSKVVKKVLGDDPKGFMR
ncbi:hypothetical protein [Bacteroides ihuae]|uniref:hypothetical protein n=1 Tax=Bacteroides ihuae TaxID=1852362 RepID=UPI0008D90E97|nr:hypothetical protein [Bacteroides ihuae]